LEHEGRLVLKGTGRTKLLLVISSLQGGGAERVMSSLASYWAEQGMNVTLVTLDDPELSDAYPLHAGVHRVHAYRPPGWSTLGRLWRTVQRLFSLRAILKQAAPDAVLSFMTATNVLTILAARGLPTRVVVSERTDPEKHRSVGWIWAYGRRRVYRSAHAVVAQSPRACAWLEDDTGADIRYIPNALREMPTVARERADWIVAVGRLGMEKGFDSLIRAFARVVGRHPGWKLILIGDGVQREALSSLCRRLDLGDTVEFTGWVEDVQWWQSRASIAAQPSRYEGFPNAVLEAMAMGTPVVATTAAGEGIIEDRKNGRVVPVDDEGALAEALLELIGDPVLRASLGAAATGVRDRFSTSRIMPMWDTVLFDQISDATGAGAK
jgi:GalNAc-alpha-(1->4)-GalNAc-alpha-(1->3)-diNAcBac-PP-undecaprenol alpha-1,4-N-acetyl-D-galactosaminyltransferase